MQQQKLFGGKLSSINKQVVSRFVILLLENSTVPWIGGEHITVNIFISQN
jgi:hypothetical protein